MILNVNLVKVKFTVSQTSIIAERTGYVMKLSVGLVKMKERREYITEKLLETCTKEAKSITKLLKIKAKIVSCTNIYVMITKEFEKMWNFTGK